MLKPREKVSDREGDLREDAVVTAYARALQLYENYRQQLIVGGVVLALLVVGYVGYRYYMNTQNAEAREALGQVVRLYEQGNYQQALEGGSGQTGLLGIVDQYGATSTGNLARYYAADAFYHLGDYERAIEHFQAFEKEENYLGASAYSGLAASHAELGNLEQAAQFYEEAARIYQNQATTPLYLQKAARYYEETGQLEEALALYEEIQSDYPDSGAAENIAIEIQRLEMRLARQGGGGQGSPSS